MSGRMSCVTSPRPCRSNALLEAVRVTMDPPTAARSGMRYVGTLLWPGELSLGQGDGRPDEK